MTTLTEAYLESAPLSSLADGPRIRHRADHLTGLLQDAVL